MSEQPILHRRGFTLGLLATAGLVTTGLLSSCDEGSGTDTDSSSTDTDQNWNNDDIEWATGGTASMSGDYDDPFATDPTACEMICAMTLGPCYAEPVVRQDISEGQPGLPVRLALRVVDTDCNPIGGAEVDVWHANINGLYSGNDSIDMCTGGDAEALAARWHRGVQTTDADGQVAFDTCFPGWYSGRAIHIHFQVRFGGNAYVTSQLFFDQDLIDTICTEHPEYEGRGTPDTPNDTDKVLGNNDPAMFTLGASKQSDGALLAYKTLVIRGSLSETLCEAPESR